MPSNTYSLVSSIITEQLPDYFHTEYDSFSGSSDSKFGEFIQSYYEYLEQTNKLLDKSNHLKNIRNVDRVLNEFVAYLKNEFMINVPETLLADKRKLMKHMQDFYRSKGNPNSFKFLFRLLFNKSIEVEYPEFLKVSDSDYQKQYSLRVKPYYANVAFTDFSLFKQRKVRGEDSGATIVIDDYVHWESHNNTITELLVDYSTLSGTFTGNEKVQALSSNGLAYIQNTGGSNVVARVLPCLTAITVNTVSSTYFEDGINHRVGESLKISGGAGYDGEATVSKTSTGQVEQILINHGGLGYTPFNMNTQVGDKISVMDSYMELCEYNGFFTVGETISGDDTGFRATVAKWDQANTALWFYESNGTFTNWTDQPYATQVEIIRGTTSKATGRIQKIHKSGGSGFFGYVSETDETGNVLNVVIENTGSNYAFVPYFTILNPANSVAYGVEFFAYGANIGNVLEVSVDSLGYGSSNGFGWGYNTEPDIAFASTPVAFDKEIQYFVNDAAEDNVATSNGGIATQTTATNTFMNTEIQAMDSSLVNMTGNGTISTLCSHNGRWLSDKGKISDESQGIHDGYYFQPFSYVLKSNEQMENWEGPVKQMAHPAGMRYFGEYTFADVAGTTVNTTFISGTASQVNASSVVYFDYGNAHANLYSSSMNSIWKMDEFGGDIIDQLSGFNFRKIDTMKQLQFGLPGIDGTAVKGNYWSYLKLDALKSDSVFINGDFTIAAWVKDTNLSELSGHIFQAFNGDDSAYNTFHVYLKGYSGANPHQLIVEAKAYDGVTTTTTDISSTNVHPYNDDEWHFITVTREGDAANVYVNAIMVAEDIDISAVPHLANDQTTLYIGAANIAGSYNQKGFGQTQDETTYWSAALNQNAVTALYNSGVGRFGTR